MENSNSKTPQYRHELKFLCSQFQISELRTRINGLMKYDQHVQDDSYLIRSLYFDDYYHTKYFQNIDGVSPRYKWRIRIYNIKSDNIFLERKVHEYDRVYKETCRLSKEKCDMLFNGNLMIEEDMEPLLKRFLVEQTMTLLRPDCIVQYKRLPFIYQLGNVRVTIDQNIASSHETHRFFEKKIALRPILPMETSLLEVKYDEYLPDVIYEQLDMNSLQRISFSKYGLCKQYNLQYNF